MNNRILPQHVEKYLKGGRATVIFHNTITDNQKKFTVIAAHKNRNDKNSEVTGYFVYQYGVEGWIARIDMSNRLFFNPVSHDQPLLTLSRNFKWVWNLIISKGVPDHIHILHLGTCSVCGRPLTDAESLERGIGPICAGL